MLIFSISFPDLIKFPYLWISLKEGFGVKGGPKTRVTLQIILVFTLTLTCPKTFTHTTPVLTSNQSRKTITGRNLTKYKEKAKKA